MDLSKGRAILRYTPVASIQKLISLQRRIQPFSEASIQPPGQESNDSRAERPTMGKRRLRGLPDALIATQWLYEAMTTAFCRTQRVFSCLRQAND